MRKLTQFFSTRQTPQREPIPGAGQVANAAGGHGWALDPWARLERFLVLGVDGGTFYAGERALTQDNAGAVLACLAEDGPRAVEQIAAISESGRAPGNDPAIFALALAAKLGDERTRRAAYAALPRVCRIGTHLLHFAAFAEAFGGWGRGMKRAVAAWFNDRAPRELALQLAKYPSRDGWAARDLLRLAHPRAASPLHDHLFAWVVSGELAEAARGLPELALVEALHRLRRERDVAAAAALIRAHQLPRECVPSELLTHAAIWEALLEAMPMTAMLRNLATMTKVGLLADGAAATRLVDARLRDRARLARARVHPLGVLAALVTYRAGRGARGASTWTPVARVVDALDAAFYASFAAAAPSGRRVLLALDVSGSMACGSIGGMPGITPRLASAAMALVTAATEPEHRLVAFTAASGGHGGKWGGGTPGLTPLAISPRQRLDDAVAEVARLPMGGTDCALPMLWAARHRVDVDCFVVYTDNETWAGDVHPAQALRAYRDARGIPAKLVVVGMTSTGFSIADPGDAGMLDVVGFDAATPPVLADFARA